MADRVDAATRSRMMAAVRGKDTKPEIAVRKALHAAGFRFRLHDKRYPGRPDIVLPRHKTAVFVNGCFWHGHGCSRSRMPASNVAFWSAKIARNQARDAASAEALARSGWTVRTVWECNLDRDVAELVACLSEKIGQVVLGD